MSSTPIPGPHAAPDPGPRVETDLACVECGYNLRTLAHSADCPECGMAVLVSARGDRLPSASPGWLHALRHGAGWLRASVVLAMPIVYLGVGLSSYGVWVLTMSQPGRVEPSQDRGYRLAGRWLTVLGSLILTAMTIGALIVVAATDQRLFGDWNMKLRSAGGTRTFGGSILDSLPAFDVMFLTAHAVYVLGLLACWRYLGILAQRVPDIGLASAWRGLARGWIISVLVLAGATGGANILIRTGILPGGSVSIWLPMAIGLLLVAVLVSLWVATLRVTGRQVRVLEAVCRE